MLQRLCLSVIALEDWRWSWVEGLLADLRLFVSSKVSVSITRPHIYVVKRILFLTLFITLALRNPLIYFFNLYMSLSINYYYNYSPVQWTVSMSLRLFWSSHLWIVSSKLLPALTMQSCASLCLPVKIKDYQWFNCDLVVNTLLIILWYYIV